MKKSIISKTIGREEGKIGKDIKINAYDYSTLSNNKLNCWMITI